MLGRRRIETSAPIRSSLADAALAVEERVVWGGADVLRGVGEVVKWPFERAIWATRTSWISIRRPDRYVVANDPTCAATPFISLIYGTLSATSEALRF